MLFKPLLFEGQLYVFFPLPLHQGIFLELITQVFIAQLDQTCPIFLSARTPIARGSSPPMHTTIRTLGRGQSFQPGGPAFLVEAAQSGRVMLGGVGW